MNPQLGTFLSIGSPAVAELAALSGFDWVLLDLEHGCVTEAAMPDQLRALRGSETRAIVRVGAPHSDLIARILDWGAHGIMVPHVNSVAAAESIVHAAHYAPRGHRGYSRTVRAHHFGLRSPEQAPTPVIMAQIESVEGVNHADGIAAVDGIDVLFIGPADLEFDLNCRAASAPGDFVDCLRTVVAAARNSGKASGILARDPADVPNFLKLGFTYVAVDSDIAILRKAWQRIRSSAFESPYC